MKHCRKWEEQIALFVLGELGATEATELHRHIDSCRPCRALYEELLAEEQRIVSAFEAIYAGEENRPEELSANFAVGEARLAPKGTIGMRHPDGGSPFRAIGRTAAAIVIAGGIIGLAIGLFKLGSATPAFAEIARPIISAKTCTYKMMVRINGGADQVFDGMFKEPGRMRQVSGSDVVQIMDSGEGKILTLTESSKQAMVVEMENLSENDASISQVNWFADLREMIAEAVEAGEGGAQFLGESSIEGHSVIGYLLEEQIFSTKVWADEVSLLPVRIETDMEEFAGYGISVIISDFEFDVELDDSLFSTEIPEGYKEDRISFDASSPTEDDLVEMLKTWTDSTGGRFPSKLGFDMFSELIRDIGRKAPRVQLQDAGADPNRTGLLSMGEEMTSLCRELVSVSRQMQEIVSKRSAILRGMDANTPNDECRRLLEQYECQKQASAAREEELQQRLEELRKQLATLREKIPVLQEEEVAGARTRIERLNTMHDEMERGFSSDIAQYQSLGFAIGRGLAFVMHLPKESNWRYDGASAAFGDANTPVFWYRPGGSDTYNVIYADMTVENGVLEIDLPEPSEASSESD